MANSFLLGLDTEAPQVSWGAVGGAEAGHLLQVAYSLSEPAPVGAEFVSSANEHVSLDVLPDHLEGLLPPGLAPGPGSVRLTVRDELGNEAVRTLAVLIVSPVAIVARRASGPGFATAPSAPGGTRTVRARSRLPVASSTTAHAGLRSRAVLALASSSTVLRTAPRPRVKLSRSRLPIVATVAVSAQAPVRSELALEAASRALRRDGEADEEALLLAFVD